MYFFCYDDQHKAYIIYCPFSRQVKVVRNIKFDEQYFISDFNDNAIVKHVPKKPKWFIQTLIYSPLQLNILSHRVTRSVTSNIYLLARIQSKNEPQSLNEATQSPHWLEAMKLEIDTLLKNET